MTETTRPAPPALAFTGRNPDVLTCIANLSNDEVATPPEFANQMLDTVETAWSDSHSGESIWEDPDVTFLDPFTKSGVFLREITRRLVDGLADKIPDLAERVDHVLTTQVYGVAITELTSLVARRSVYCSKLANGKHSIARSFDDPDGNIWFERTEHTWVGGAKVLTADSDGNEVEKTKGGKCKFCGSPQATLDRESDLESHAYAFIHSDDISARIAELFGENMQFDVVIGNPPYHLGDGGGSGSSAISIYQKFVEQAQLLEPRMLTMVIPARWFTGGKGLDVFRASMLSDERIRSLVDYPISADVFPRNGPKGGICTFVWERDNPGPCSVTTNFQGEATTTSRRLLSPGSDVFIRFNQGLSVLEKVAAVDAAAPSTLALPDDRRFDELVSVRRPFGFDSTFRGTAKAGRDDDLRILQKGGTGFVPRKKVSTGLDLIDAWKVFVGFAAPGTGDKDTYPHRVISTPFLGAPGTVCTETYLCIGPFATREMASSALSYMSCRLTRFLIQLHKASQNTTRKVYRFVPTQAWDRVWTDAELYEKYGISDDEVAFIESVVRPMELVEAGSDA